VIAESAAVVEAQGDGAIMVTDDLGTSVDVRPEPRRVVSLVPSLTESLADTGRLVGATDWCTHPDDLDVARVRGTKNPDLEAIRALAPDLVVANKEENRELDVRRLRDSGLPVWVTDIESVPQALRSLERLFTQALGLPTPPWLDEVEELWSGPLPNVHRTVAVAIWRDPWMVVGSRTFSGDLLRRLGIANAFDVGAERYPHIDLAQLDRPGLDLVLLPDEPYPFSVDDGPEAFSRVPTQLVSGRLITWYGPSLLAARAELGRLL
jgi:ABC-type Fe3+-hydroxamate transport system substrate-binding protein